VPSGSPKATLQLVREISMLDVGSPLVDMALIAPGRLTGAPAIDLTDRGGWGTGSTSSEDVYSRRVVYCFEVAFPFRINSL